MKQRVGGPRKRTKSPEASQAQTLMKIIKHCQKYGEPKPGMLETSRQELDQVMQKIKEKHGIK